MCFNVQSGSLFWKAFILYKIVQSHTCQKWPAIESEWGKMKETTSVQEHVVLANIKASDQCVCGCMYTHAISHTHTHHTPMHTNYCEFYTYFILPWTACNMPLWIWYYYSLSLSHTHTHVQTAFSLACIDFKIIFSFTTYSRQNIMTIGFEAFVFSQSRRKFTNKCFSTEREHKNASQCLACHLVKPDFHPKLRI